MNDSFKEYRKKFLDLNLGEKEYISDMEYKKLE